MGWTLHTPPRMDTSTQGFDATEARRALALLGGDSPLVNLRGLVPGGGIPRSVILPATDTAGLLQAAEEWGRQGRNVYLCLNHLLPDTVRPPNKGALVGNVARRTRLFVDVDPRKPEEYKDASATTEEKAGAERVRDRIRTNLDTRGWPAPVVIDSGNGYYLIYALDLPNDDPSRVLVQGVLGHIERTFGSPDGKIDGQCHDANRIAKLPGTLARKGPHTDERPHRMCRLVEVPEPWVVVPTGLLEALVAPPVAKAQTNGAVPPSSGWPVHAAHPPRLSLEERAIRYLATVEEAVQGQKGSNPTFFAARALVWGFELDQGTALRLLMDHYNPRCRPAWSERELQHKVEDAATKDFSKARGWLLKDDNPRYRAEDFREGEPAVPREVVLTARPEPWPDPPTSEAYHGLAGIVVDRIIPHTEADPVALLAQFLVFFGNAAGRCCYRTVGSKRHFPNLFGVLVGRTAKGRKGTSLDWIESLFRSADPGWSERCVTTGLSTGEGLINAVRDRVARQNADGDEEVSDEGVEDKRLLVIEEEFAQVLRLATRDGNIVSSVIRQAWDGGRLRTLTRHNPLRATDAHISTVGHVTRDELARCLTSTDQSNGFANRFLWLAVRRSKLLPDGGEQIDLSDLAARLATTLDWARSGPRRLGRTLAARNLWHAEYPRLSAERPGAVGLCTNRAEAQVLRLASVYTILDATDEIDLPHLRAALALWDYCERSCRWVFGESIGDPDADEILEALQAAGDLGLSGRDIHSLFARHRTASQLGKALAKLVEAGLVRNDRKTTTGRPVDCWKYTGKCEQRVSCEQSPPDPSVSR